MESLKINLDTFCITPWIHLKAGTTGAVQPCCEFRTASNLNLFNMPIDEIWHSDLYKNLRQDLANGIKVKDCETCWNKEKYGITSRRQLWNERWKEYITPEFLNDPKLITLDVRFSNVCNLKCVMCSAANSTNWYKDTEKLHNKYQNTRMLDQTPVIKSSKEMLETLCKLPLRRINFAGGEPFLMEEHDIVLDLLVKNNNPSDIILNYTINGTVFDNDYIEIWKNFNKILVTVSMDGYGELLEVHRYPAKTDKILETLDILSKIPNIFLSINYAVTALNYRHIIPFYLWLKEHENLVNIDISLDLVHNPTHLSTSILPIEYKQFVSNDINAFCKRDDVSSEMKDKLLYLEGVTNSVQRDDLYPKFLEYLDDLDILRNTKGRELFENIWRDDETR